MAVEALCAWWSQIISSQTRYLYLFGVPMGVVIGHLDIEHRSTSDDAIINGGSDEKRTLFHDFDMLLRGGHLR